MHDERRRALVRLFREHADLVAVLALLVLVALRAHVPTGARYAVAALFLLWAPGYLLVEALSPRGRVPVDGSVERHGLAVGLSLALTPLLALPLFVADALRPARLLTIVTLVVVGLAGVVVWQRTRGHGTASPAWLAGAAHVVRHARPAERVAAVALAMAVVAAAGAVHFNLANVTEARSTEAYLTDRDDQFLPHPFVIEPGRLVHLRLHVVEHAAPTTYTATTSFDVPDGPRVQETVNATPGEEVVVPFSLLPPYAMDEAWVRVNVTSADGEVVRELRVLVSVEQHGPPNFIP